MQIKKESDHHILLTGGTGFLGSFLSAELLHQGFHITFLARSKHGKEERARIHEKLGLMGVNKDFVSRIHVVSGDISQPLCGISGRWVEEHKGKIKAIWHTAGLTSFYNKAALSAINVQGTEYVIDLASRLSAYLHYVSTAYVAGNLPEGKILEDELKEPPSFHNFYEKSKHDAEKLVRQATLNDSINSTIYRSSILIGHSKTGQAFSFTGYYVPLLFFHELKRTLDKYKIFSQLPIIIPYREDARLNLIPIDEAVRLMTSLARNLHSRNKTFHIVHPNPPDVRFVFEVSLALLGYKNVKFIRVPLLGMKILASLLLGSSYFLGRFGKNLRTHLGSYTDYIIDRHEFSTKNVKLVLGEKAQVSPLSQQFFKSCIDYVLQVRNKYQV